MDLDTLYAAAFAGDTDAIVELEKKLDRLSRHDRTILHIESMYGNAERVRYIVMMFSHRNIMVQVDAFGQTALHLAADCGHTQVVRVLIDAARRLPFSGTDDVEDPVSYCFEDFVRQGNNKMNTALHLAVNIGHMAIAKMLVEADPCDRHIQNHDDETPVYIAAKLGHNDIVKLICTTCAAPSLDGPLGTTALHPVIMKLHEAKIEDSDVAAVLIDAAKRSSYSEDAAYNSFEALFSNTDECYSVLHLAVQANNLDAVALILKEDPTCQPGRLSKQDDLRSLIHIAAEKGYNNVAKLLCIPYEAGNSLGNKGQMALQAAIIGRDREAVIELLSENRYLVTYKDHRGWTPLHYAAYYKFDLVLEVIIDSMRGLGFDVWKKEGVLTPVHIAAKEGHNSTVKHLLRLIPGSSRGVNQKGENILHVLAFQKNKTLLQSILDNCISATVLNEKDMNGDTPLHILIREGCYVPELIKHKEVDLRATNNQGWTPLDMLYFKEEITDE